MREPVSSKVRVTCDGCGEQFVYETVGPESEQTSIEAQRWYLISRKLLSSDGRPVGLQVDACCLACGPAAMVKLALPPDLDDQPSVDLNSLRASSYREN